MNDRIEDKIDTIRNSILKKGGIVSQQIKHADKRGLVVFSRATGAESIHLYKIMHGLDNQGGQDTRQILRACIWSDNFTTDELANIIRKSL